MNWLTWSAWAFFPRQRNSLGEGYEMESAGAYSSEAKCLAARAGDVCKGERAKKVVRVESLEC